MKLNTLQLRRAANALLLGLLLGVAMPKMNAQTAHVGDILCEGDLIVSPANYNASTHTAKAVVFYVDNTGQHGWAIALEDAGIYSWQDDYFDDTPLPNYTSKRQAICDLDGYHNTGIVREHSIGHAAFYAVDFENGWYVPTIGQFNYLYGNLLEVNQSLIIARGTTFPSTDWHYWSSTEISSQFAWYLKYTGELCYSGDAYSSEGSFKTYGKRVRAAINF